MTKLCTLFCLVQIKKCSYLTSCVFTNIDVRPATKCRRHTGKANFPKQEPCRLERFTGVGGFLSCMREDYLSQEPCLVLVRSNSGEQLNLTREWSPKRFFYVGIYSVADIYLLAQSSLEALPLLLGFLSLLYSPRLLWFILTNTIFYSGVPQECCGNYVYYYYSIVLMGAFISIFSKLTQSATGLKVVKPAGNGRYITLLFTFTVQKYMYPPVRKVHGGSFRVSVIHRILTWTTGFLTCGRHHSSVCVYTLGLGTPTASQHSIFDSEQFSQSFLVLLTGLEPRVFITRVRRSTD